MGSVIKIIATQNQDFLATVATSHKKRMGDLWRMPNEQLKEMTLASVGRLEYIIEELRMDIAEFAQGIRVPEKVLIHELTKDDQDGKVSPIIMIPVCKKYGDVFGLRWLREGDGTDFY